ncbi:MAG: Na+/H+ antiporter subunit E [Deltaproteobacteria bacterium]|nr:Na+/H+ antiporter subunit E [Deltaproteobacteria bacterium]MBW2018998.1 Na+/H+ antiporter subunit E [Deltaproteobacteria bacterium]MBW2073588.1 Na+/H+ antiporter subunit E [Deltaproteobacteria bacterium]
MDRQNQENLGTNRSPTNNEERSSTQSLQGRRLFFYPFLITFIIMFGLWLVLSGHFDAFHMSLGLISCAIVSYLSSDLLFPSPRIRGLFSQWVRFVRYVPWLMVEIIKANLHVTYLVFHPRMMELIDPRIIKFRSKLKSDLALVTFANSITLTPGTITVYVSIDGDFKVHAIDKASGDPLPGEMEARIARTFGEV